MYSRDFRRPSSEFPHDNSELSDGAVWVCRSTTATARAVVRPSSAALFWPKPVHNTEASGPTLVASPPEDIADVPPEPRLEPTGFAQLLRALEGVLLERGATRAAAAVATLFEQARLPVASISDAASAELCARGYAHRGSGELTLSDTTRGTLEGWRNALDGRGDLAACGESSLDGFCAELGAALAGTPEAAPDLRRALRARGVAAFGLFCAAA